MKMETYLPSANIHNLDNKYGYLMMFLSACFFFVTNYFIARSANSVCASWRWRNLFNSWIHAVICGSWDIVSFILYGSDVFADLVTHANYFTYSMAAFCTGYFIYDSIDLGLNNKLISEWGITLHHIFVISMFWYQVHEVICIGYTVVALMAEINSIFLHLRKLLQIAGIGFGHWFYKFITYTNLVTFVACRGFCIIRIMIGIYTEHYRLPIFYVISLSVSIISVAVINIVLFWRLFKSDFLKPLFGLRKDLKKANGNNNGIDKKDE